MAFVYENLGSVDVYGAEFGANIILSDMVELSAALSIVDKNQFESSGPTSELVALNAPTLKGTFLERLSRSAAALICGACEEPLEAEE